MGAFWAKVVSEWLTREIPREVFAWPRTEEIVAEPCRRFLEILARWDDFDMSVSLEDVRNAGNDVVRAYRRAWREYRKETERIAA